MAGLKLVDCTCLRFAGGSKHQMYSHHSLCSLNRLQGANFNGSCKTTNGGFKVKVGADHVKCYGLGSRASFVCMFAFTWESPFGQQARSPILHHHIRSMNRLNNFQMNFYACWSVKETLPVQIPMLVLLNLVVLFVRAAKRITSGFPQVCAWQDSL